MAGVVVFLGCLYEAIALATGRVPTLTAWTARGRSVHPWWTLAVVACLVACLVVHLWRAKP